MTAANSNRLNAPKPELIVRLSADAEGSLAALDHLPHLKKECLYHTKLDKRHPLGIYNVSILRICSKIKRCCEKFETYMSSASCVKDFSSQQALREELLDYLELCLYAATEHVDDIESIASCFFANSREYAKSKDVRNLKRSIKPIRDRLSAFANALKHNQSRIRIFSADFLHEETSICLHGLFIESFRSGAVGPCPILHPSNEQVVSVTSFLWDIIIFIFETSIALNRFMKVLSVVRKSDVKPEPCVPYGEAILALARLPTYSYDEEHPFNRVKVVIEGDEAIGARLESGIYGSLRRPWTKSGTLKFGDHSHNYTGDGVTRTFALVAPSTCKLLYWD